MAVWYKPQLLRFQIEAQEGTTNVGFIVTHQANIINVAKVLHVLQTDDIQIEKNTLRQECRSFRSLRNTVTHSSVVGIRGPGAEAFSNEVEKYIMLDLFAQA